MIERFIRLVDENPFLLDPVEGMNDRAAELFSLSGFMLYPTVRKTLLVYDKECDCFIKVLHQLSLKDRIYSLLSDRSRKIFEVSQKLASKGIGGPPIVAYGVISLRKAPFYGMKKMKGISLYDLFIRGGAPVKIKLMTDLMESIARLHAAGFWLGDAHLSHVFAVEDHIEGFIDLDSIRRIALFHLKKRAKDIAGMFHPGVSIPMNDRRSIMEHYMKVARLKKEEKFMNLTDCFIKRRWNS
jgi:hypothetical protein